jgi:alanyl-tRNA synthetase
VQAKSSVYETDLFSPLIQRICQLTHKAYGENRESDRAIRIIAEHGRGIPFLIADGVLPSNEGRGYVLRRVLRRTSLFARRLGLDKPFLSEVAEVLANKMGNVYPELIANRGLIREEIKAEEVKFINTLDSGLNLAERLINEALEQGREQLPGEEIFRLYDTYGFPKELTAEIAKERGLSVDLEGFQVEMEKQRERARAAQKFVTASDKDTATEKARVERIYGSTEFIGYETTVSQSKVLELRVKGQPCEAAAQSDALDIILNKTPFYGEMGGQVGDIGEISSQRGKVAVTNTIRAPSDVIVHQGKVIAGSISVSDEVEAKIDVAHRLDIASNHTATHLLQAALRQILDTHVSQRGSLVEPERFRFDFSHTASMAEEQFAEIQRWVNEKIRQNLPVKARIVPYKQAKDEGAIALFEEKYGETVRMIEIGEPAISKELCGGTHVKSTGGIGFFLITGESSIGTGLRRIEAATGRAAESLVEKRFSVLQSMVKEVGSSLEEVSSKVRALISELEMERKRSLSLERELSHKVAESLLQQTEQVNGVTVLAAKVLPLTMPVLREMGDILRDKLKSAIVVLATIYDGKPNFLAMVTPDLVAKGFHAGDIVKQVAKVTGGGGGGKASMAQAGGKNVAKLDEALNLVKGLVASRISSPSRK